VIVLDEPFQRHRHQDLGRSAGAGAALAQRKTTVLAALHDMIWCARIPDRFCWRARPVAWGATAEV